MRHEAVVYDTSVAIDVDKLDLGEWISVPAVITAVVLGELAFGLDVADPLLRARRTERFYGFLRDFEILPYDLEAAKMYGVMASTLRQINRNPRGRRLDLQIAATAATNAMPLLTRNPKDFVGLERLVEVHAI
ncbi:type II toxin-antitoxin system VapC family toxin [Pseudonocardiaceae bacterium YIM PH 21723]|nr:type II toxin-antitoxin system VapC family toxin [Pseudonocardiaceae bacterium YIM PH 21723]